MRIRFKEAPEDFYVEEIPLYNFSGRGDHAIIKVKKKGITTLEVIHRISGVLDVSEKQIGYAGMKDKVSVSVQYISIPKEYFSKKELKYIEDEHLEILDVTFHKNKLKPGHLLGNLFRLRVWVEKPEEFLRKLEDAVEEGFPNFFDEQRFSRHNLEYGLKLLRGEKIKASPYHKRLFVSSVSSYIFNLYLKRRKEMGYLHAIMEGDILKKSQGRQIPTGPIWGYKMKEAEADAGELEKSCLLELGIRKEDFKRAKAKGTRRVIKVYPENVEVKREGNVLWLKFFLPRGAFATVLLKYLAGLSII